MSLEQMVKQAERTMVISDIHVPFHDEKALKVVYQYAKDYKPTRLIVNGDLVDFYGLSFFEKNTARRHNVQEEIDQASKILGKLRTIVGPKAEMVYLEGNHENRLQRYLWKNPELEGIRDLRLPNLLDLAGREIQFIGVTSDYWKDTSGHLEVGDALVTHGDNRLNGTSTSRYSGYSARNSIVGLQQSIIMGHVHRLGKVYQSNGKKHLVGIEGGCLCVKNGTANWQQGFVTFETYKGKNYNYQIHHIHRGMLVTTNTVYKG